MADNIFKNFRNNRDFQNKLKHAPYMGIYLGIVRQASEETRSGMLNVFIPALSEDPTDQASATFNCFWSSPFAGGTDPSTLGTDVKKYDTGQKSYGMWMVPPDVGNMVLVCFADGSSKMPYVIATLFPDQLNHMVPGMPAGKSYSSTSMPLPVIEKNKRDGRSTHNDAVRPVHVDIAEAITLQGLINDPIRGSGTSGARRESPSEVFGILTPGPRDPGNWDHRLGGHQFVMDDNLDSRLIRLRTAQGAQILMDDTNGIVYIINKKGNAWVELTNNGDIHVYSDSNINMRAKGNFNIRADKNINMEAGETVNIRAAAGSINNDAKMDVNLHAGANQKHTAGGSLDTSAGSTLALTSGAAMDIKSGAALQAQSGAATSILAGGHFAVNSSQTALHASQILLNSGGPTAKAAKDAAKLEPLQTQPKMDVSSTPPEFDREAANRGEVATPTGGYREGAPPSIDTIVTVMPTLEPFAGHEQHNAAKAPLKGQAQYQPPSDLPENSVDTSGTPADTQTPQGMTTG